MIQSYRPLPEPLRLFRVQSGPIEMPPLPPDLAREFEEKEARNSRLRQARLPLAELTRTGTAVHGELALPYRYYIPEVQDDGRPLPLILFLHGAGERGDDNLSQIVANDGFLIWVREQLSGNQEPCYVVAPQCPETGYGWLEPQLLCAMEAVEAIKAAYPVDEDRIYVTGMSMGGGGCWRVNYMFPDVFAALVPICSAAAIGSDGQIDREALELAADAFRGKPFWLFHAVDDGAVPVETSRCLAEAMERRGMVRGQDFFYTEYPAELHYNHGSWEPAYENDAMRLWLFRQKRT